METMNVYTIFCTEEQTKKALAVGVPIEYIDANTIYGKPKPKHSFYIEIPFLYYRYYLCPTAEQMIGCLEKQGILVLIDPSQDKFYGSYSLRRDDGYWSNRIFLDGLYPSREEATRAAIDAALEYLTKKIRYNYENNE